MTTNFPVKIQNWKEHPPQTILDFLGIATHDCFPDRLWSLGGSLVERTDDGDLKPVPVARHSALLAEAAAFYVISDSGESYTKPNRTWASDLVNRPERWCRPLRAVVHTPYLSADNRVITQPGYDPHTQIWLQWTGSPVDPSSVSQADVNAVLTMLADFPFVNAMDATHGFGLLLLPLVRSAIKGPTPMHVVHAEHEGVGKTYLVEIAGTIALGHKPTIRGLSGWGSEAERQLTTMLRSNPSFLFLDNLQTGALLGGTELHRYLTADGPVKIRPIGSGSEFSIQIQCTWVCTLNSPDFDTEMARRTIPIRFRRVRDRKFRTPDLDRWVAENRSFVLACLLKLVQNWLDAGKPKPSRTLGSYGDWSDVVGGILSHMGWGETWLHPDHRPTTKLVDDWALLFVNWPEDTDGEWALANATSVISYVDQLDLHHIQNLIEAPTHRGRVTKLGLALRQLAKSNRDVSGMTLRTSRSRNGAQYRPGRPPAAGGGQ